VRFDCVDPHRTLNILQPLFPKIIEFKRYFPAHLVVGGNGEADAARLRYTLKPRCDIDAISEDVIALDQDVTEVDPYPVQHAPILSDALVTLGHHRLHSYGTIDGIDHRGKLKQHTVPRALHEASPVFRHESIDDSAVFAKSAGRADIVEAH
jgi:hypothetical protein